MTEVTAFCKTTTPIPSAHDSGSQRSQTEWIEILRYLEIGDGFKFPKNMDHLPRVRGNRPPDYELQYERLDTPGVGVMISPGR